MKILSVLALTAASSSAFMPATPAFARSSALQITKEEDLELTRKAIQDFQRAQDGGAPEKPKKKKAEKPVAKVEAEPEPEPVAAGEE